MTEDATQEEANRDRIYIYRLGRLWYFKHFFEEPQLFDALSRYYNRERFRFELASSAELEKVTKYLEANGFEPVVVEDRCGLR
jgi:hypothetical protein